MAQNKKKKKIKENHKIAQIFRSKNKNTSLVLHFFWYYFYFPFFPTVQLKLKLKKKRSANYCLLWLLVPAILRDLSVFIYFFFFVRRATTRRDKSRDIDGDSLRVALVARCVPARCTRELVKSEWDTPVRYTEYTITWRTAPWPRHAVQLCRSLVHLKIFPS